ncbi:ran guanine nucleotide release factor-like [Oscarella lobularis]|uniref:ran guanine nucleotide release factor-like n=1 Tax=Oscarella lobularis TaxID=121494 RepID=UPI003313DF43
MSSKLLFGGAFTCVLPSCSVDISQIRQVPDNQEVFAHLETDQSVLIELLEYSGDVQGTQAAEYYFNDLAESNQSRDQKIESVSEIPKEQIALHQCCDAYRLIGCQRVSKFRDEAAASEPPHKVHTEMFLLRLPQHTTDILLTFNDPYPDLASRQHAAKWTSEDFYRICVSLKLVDLSIFPENVVAH